MKKKLALKEFYNLVFFILNLVCLASISLCYVLKIKLQLNLAAILVSLFLFVFALITFIFSTLNLIKKEIKIANYFKKHKKMFLIFLIVQTFIFLLCLIFLIYTFAFNLKNKIIKNEQLFFIATLIITLLMVIVANCIKQVVFTLAFKKYHDNLILEKIKTKENSMPKNSKLINQYLDSTLLKSDASIFEIEKLCNEAKKYHFYSVCVNPYYISAAKKYLKNTNVKVISVIGFPLGANSMATKIFEVKNSLLENVDELDVVINIGALKNQNYDYVFEELNKIKKSAPNIILKAIIEITILSEFEIEKIVAIIKKVNFDFIKTSTGFTNKKVEVNDILKIKKALQTSKIKIKASGGIYNYENALEFIQNGVERIGTSKAKQIVLKDKNYLKWLKNESNTK